MHFSTDRKTYRQKDKKTEKQKERSKEWTWVHNYFEVHTWNASVLGTDWPTKTHYKQNAKKVSFFILEKNTILGLEKVNTF